MLGVCQLQAQFLQYVLVDPDVLSKKQKRSNTYITPKDWQNNIPMFTHRCHFANRSACCDLVGFVQ